MAMDNKPANSSFTENKSNSTSNKITRKSGNKYPRKRAKYPIDCFIDTITLSPGLTLKLPDMVTILFSLPDMLHEFFSRHPAQFVLGDNNTVTEFPSVC